MDLSAEDLAGNSAREKSPKSDFLTKIFSVSKTARYFDKKSYIAEKIQ